MKGLDEHKTTKKNHFGLRKIEEEKEEKWSNIINHFCPNEQIVPLL